MPNKIDIEFAQKIRRLEKELKRLESLINRPTVTSSSGTIHDPVTVVDTATINLTLTGQQLQADLLGGGSAIPADGWISAGVTWTDASASTFTITGDYTAIYKKGVKLKWTNASGSNPRYGHVKIDSTYSAPNTTVTIITNTDFVIANDAISLNYYSLIERPSNFPNYFNFTPTISNLTIGNAIVSATYTINGFLLWLKIYIKLGNTSSVAASAGTLTLPVEMVSTGSSTLMPIGMIGYRDNGVGSFFGQLNGNSTTAPPLLAFNASGTYLYVSSMTNTVPFTFTTNDEIDIVAQYQI